jgi:hypothetical protein
MDVGKHPNAHSLRQLRASVEEAGAVEFHTSQRHPLVARSPRWPSYPRPGDQTVGQSSPGVERPPGHPRLLGLVHSQTAAWPSASDDGANATTRYLLIAVSSPCSASSESPSASGATQARPCLCPFPHPRRCRQQPLGPHPARLRRRFPRLLPQRLALAAFNIADSAITTGALWLIPMWRPHHAPRRPDVFPRSSRFPPASCPPTLWWRPPSSPPSPSPPPGPPRRPQRRHHRTRLNRPRRPHRRPSSGWWSNLALSPPAGQLFTLSTLQSGGAFLWRPPRRRRRNQWTIRSKLPILPTLDAFAPGIALGHAIGASAALPPAAAGASPATAPGQITFTTATRANSPASPRPPASPTQL